MVAGDLGPHFSQLRSSLSTDQQKQLDLLQMATDAAASAAAADLKRAEKAAKDAEKYATLAHDLAQLEQERRVDKEKETQQQTSSFVSQVCKFKCVLENRYLLEQAAEKLYASECTGTAAQVQKLINNQVLLPRPPLASRAQAAPTPHPVASLA